MVKRTKLEETFNLPPMDLPDTPDEDVEEVTGYTEDEMHQIMERADKIDAALPQVAGLDNIDADYDEYARKAIETFDDLVDLGKNVEDRFAADIFNAASSMMGNALNAKTNKAQKKLEMVKLQIQKAKLEHENEKLDYLKKRHLKDNTEEAAETDGSIISTRNDVLADILAGMKKDSDS
jgi:hypothetical protein